MGLEARNTTLGAEGDEGHRQELEQARKGREDRPERINIAVDYLARLLGPMNEQNGWLYTRTSRIYDLADLPQTSTALAFLPREFWAAFERCQAVHTRWRDIELDLQDSEQQQQEALREIDERMIQAVHSIRPSAEQQDAFVADTLQDERDAARQRLRSLAEASIRNNEFEVLIENTKDMHYAEEAILDEVVADAFVETGALTAETGAKEILLRRRWAYTKKPLPTDFEEEQGENAGAVPLAGDKDAFAARVQYALQKVQECNEELYNIRRAPLSNAVVWTQVPKDD